VVLNDRYENSPRLFAYVVWTRLALLWNSPQFLGLEDLILRLAREEQDSGLNPGLLEEGYLEGRAR